MDSNIEYLYGDSTPSPLKTDFIAFLRDAVDFSVEVLKQDALTVDAAQQAMHLAEVTERELVSAEQLAAEAARVLESAAAGDEDSLAARCAARIRQSIHEVVLSQREASRAAVAAEKARAARTLVAAREACTKALERLVSRQDLPEAAAATNLRLAEEGYVLDCHLHTPYGLHCLVRVDIPPSHVFAQPLRVDHVMERLDVQAPQPAGWLHKELKIRPQHLHKLYITEINVDAGGTRMTLRAAHDHASAGFEVELSADASDATIARLSPGATSPEPRDTVQPEDVDKIRALRDDVVERANALLAEHKYSLIAARLDDTPLQKLDVPRLLAERLIAHIAPIVEEISTRSPVAGELTIKRQLSDSHREENFVSKGELWKRIEPLPDTLRHAFDPLKLWGIDGVEPDAAPHALRESNARFSAGALAGGPRKPGPNVDATQRWPTL